MKISVLADCHLGAGYNTDLENDPFDNFEEALEKSSDCDVILIAGDLFDSRSPRTTVWARAISMLTRPLAHSSGVKLLDTNKKLGKVHERTMNSIPVLCLHGNHDRRMRDEVNAVQALDSAGMLVHLHKQTMVFEKNGVKVAIHGMSSVPERYAGKNLKEWNPQPIPGCFNILVMHQNVDPYVYSPLEPPSIKLADLPKGFDFILNGHIHSRSVDRLDEKSTFMILGSTVTTQFDSKEAAETKGFHKITFENDKLPEVRQVPIESNRKFFYHEVKVEEPQAMREEVDRFLGEIDRMKLRKPPVAKVKLFGKDTKVIDHDIAVMDRKYSDKMILSIVKKLDSVEIAEKLEFMKNLGDNRMSVEEIGLKLLKGNLKEMDFDSSFNPEHMFGMLTDNAVEKAMAVLTGDQKTLYDTGASK